MDAPDPAAPARVNLAAAVRAHLLLVVLMTLGFAALGAAAALVVPQEYSSSTRVLLLPLEGNPYSPGTQGSDLTNLETEAQVVSSDVIEQQVREDLDARFGKPNVGKGLSVAVTPNTQIIKITYGNADAAVAKAVSGQYAQSFLDYRAERRTAYLDSRRTALEKRIDELTTRLDQLRREGRGNLDAQVKALGGQLLNLRLQLASLDAGDSSSSGEILAKPSSKATGLSLPVWAAALAGAVVGLALGLLWAVLRERRRGLLRSVDDLEYLGIPVLGRLGPATEHTVGSGPSDAALMVGAVLNRRVERPSTVAVSAVTTPPAEVPFAEDLASALAQGESAVLLVDAVGVATKEPGLSEALNTAELGDQLSPTPGAVATLSAGQHPEEAARLYGSARMEALLEHAMQRFPWVVVRGSGTERTPGRATVGACRYWVPLVVLGSTTRDELDRSLTWARTTGTQTLGVVAVHPAAAQRRPKHEASAAVDE
ncbi:MAG TPA: Wzz/FepE/Etk N-terminal domain-containing protein [Nocardioides sp.]|uniref:Wzz/FepE/Etk N-terminal domain-containing protein n=1 Tax=Nocardioides sp. TaxID=35761 RepID=UPI002C096D90|nr:Wzz/FepE/Etk N-terminal domain-containing protein [Nocardioides sp.]HQR26678.1 Wzz/FepE/Etk N-terminal domain-containing protein [Nocardioides sp.]